MKLIVGELEIFVESINCQGSTLKWVGGCLSFAKNSFAKNPFAKNSFAKNPFAKNPLTQKLFVQKWLGLISLGLMLFALTFGARWADASAVVKAAESAGLTPSSASESSASKSSTIESSPPLIGQRLSAGLSAVLQKSSMQTVDNLLPPDQAFVLQPIAEIWQSDALPEANSAKIGEAKMPVGGTKDEANNNRITLRVSYLIAPQYYLYQNRFVFNSRSSALKVGAPIFPKAEWVDDATFGRVQIFRERVSFDLPLIAVAPVMPNEPFSFSITSQGCANVGVCYPPQTVEIPLSDAVQHFLQAAMSTSPRMPKVIDDSSTPLPSVAPLVNPTAAQILNPGDEVESASDSPWNKVLAQQSWWRVVALFVVLGFGLALTPCVLPMIPIVSTLIVGQAAELNRAVNLRWYEHPFNVTLIYCAGVVSSYTALGTVAGALGVGLSAYLQAPWLLVLFATVVVMFAVALWRGMGKMQLVPQYWVDKVAPWHVGALETVDARSRAASTHVSKNSFKKLFTTFLFGVLSALLIGPCVAPPLAGILLFISQTQNLTLGAVALASLSLGMCVPLLLIGATSQKCLPRSGAWMASVSKFFSFLLLALALWIVSPLLSPRTVMALFALLGTGATVYFVWAQLVVLHRRTETASRRGQMVVALLFALIFANVAWIEGWGAWHNAIGPLAPFTPKSQRLAFERIHNWTEWQQIKQEANQQQQWLMLDFYADWCTTCIEMETRTFINHDVQKLLSRVRRVQIDVTANTADDREMLAKMKLFGPPAIIFFVPSSATASREKSREKPQEKSPEGSAEAARIIGYVPAETFIRRLTMLGMSAAD